MLHVYSWNWKILSKFAHTIYILTISRHLTMF